MPRARRRDAAEWAGQNWRGVLAVAGVLFVAAVAVLALVVANLAGDKGSLEEKLRTQTSEVDANGRRVDDLERQLRDAGIDPTATTVVVPGPRGQRGPRGPAGPAGPAGSTPTTTRRTPTTTRPSPPTSEPLACRLVPFLCGSTDGS